MHTRSLILGSVSPRRPFDLALGLTIALGVGLTTLGCDQPPDDLESAEPSTQALERRPDGMGRHMLQDALRPHEGLSDFDGQVYGAEYPSNRLYVHNWYGFTLQVNRDCTVTLVQTIADHARGTSTTKTLWRIPNRQIFPGFPGPGHAPPKPHTDCYLQMQGDGNLVLYGRVPNARWNEPDYAPLWSSNTWGNDGAHLQLERNGDLVVYAANGHRLWHSNTGVDIRVVDQEGNGRPGSGVGEPPYPGCRFARTDITKKCGLPPRVPFGAWACRDIWVCSNDVHPREVASDYYPCGVCVTGTFN